MSFLKHLAIGIGRGLAAFHGRYIGTPYTSDGQHETVFGPPDEAELDALSISSTELRLEYRGDGVFRLATGDQWADVRLLQWKPASVKWDPSAPLGASISKEWIDLPLTVQLVAGNYEPPDAAEFERLAAQKIAEDFLR